MNLKQLAEWKQNGKETKIAKWADETGIAEIEEGVFLLFVGEAYEKSGRMQEAKEAYQKALCEYEEEAAERLTAIYVQERKPEQLTVLSEQLEELGIAENCLAKARFEAARLGQYPLDEQSALLLEYADSYYDEKYYILLLEYLLCQGKQTDFQQYLVKYREMFANSVYEEYEEALEEASRLGTAKPKKSIQEVLYGEIYKETSAPPEVKSNVRIKTHGLNDLISSNLFQGMIKSDKRLKKEPPAMEERFADIVGMEEIREQVGSVYRVVKMEMERQSNDYRKEMLATTHFAISGAHGSGKTLLAETIGQILADFGIRSAEQAVSIEGKDFSINYDELNKLNDVTLIIENVERCLDEHGKYGDFAWQLQKYLNDHKKNISVIITGTKDGIQGLQEEERNIREAIYEEFSIPEYTVEELTQMFQLIARQNGWVLTEEAIKVIKKQLAKERKMSTFATGKSIQEKLTEAQRRAADRFAVLEDVEDKDMVVLEAKDFAGEGMNTSIVELLEQLNDMTGLASVKQQVNKMISKLLTAQEAEKAGSVRAMTQEPLHMIFKGAPGTGKTTVARIIGQIYQTLGVLPGNKEGLLECSSPDLIGQYVGETAQKTVKIINRAMGGVLFVDEAYSLMQNQFGQEAITTMLKAMEDYRDSIMIIFAGYDEDMEKLLDQNAGLRSRMPNQIKFEDYKEEELYCIFRSMISVDHRYLGKDTKELVQELIAQGSKAQDFGNARGVRNLVGLVESALDERVFEMVREGKQPSTNDYEIIRKEDIESVLNHSTAGSKNLEELLEELNQMEGMEQLNEIINQNVNMIKAAETKKKLGLEGKVVLDNLHMVFLGGPGTGKTTMARKIGLIYKVLGILPKGDQITECSRPELVGEYQGHTASKVMDLINHSMGGILFIDEAYTLSRDDSDSFGQEAIDTLVKSMEDKRGKFMVILAGYTEEMEHFLDKNPGLRSRVANQVLFEDFTLEQMQSIFCKLAAHRGYQFEAGIEPILHDLLEEKSGQKDFGNARGVRNVWNQVTRVIDNRIVEEGEEITREDCHMVKKADLEKLITKKQSKEMEITIEDLLNQLDQMIGLHSVKAAVHQIVQEAQYNLWAAEHGIGSKNEHGTLHMIFKGNAGTGKTTVARMLGKIYCKMGILRSGQCIECDRKVLVAGYVGQTAIQTQKYIDKALGGILFVDEAYTLNQGGENDFGNEALTTIMKAMEDNRDDLMVVFAGYSEEMDALIAANQGLESRFSKQNEIIFEDYTEKELLAIFLFQAKKMGVEVSEELYPLIQQKIVLAKKESKSFGNARGVRNLAEAFDRNRKQRIAGLIAGGKDPDVKEAVKLMPEDLNC